MEDCNQDRSKGLRPGGSEEEDRKEETEAEQLKSLLEAHRIKLEMGERKREGGCKDAGQHHFAPEASHL